MSESSLTYECPNHNIVCQAKFTLIEFSIKKSFRLQWGGQTVLMTPILSVKLKKVNFKSPQHENITYKFIAYWMQSSILFCCTETNNILRAVSSREDAVFSMRTFTWSWCLPVSGICRSIDLNVETARLHFGTRLTSTCLRSRHLPVVGRHTCTMAF